MSCYIIQCSRFSTMSEKLKVGPFYQLDAQGSKPTIPLIRVRDDQENVVLLQTHIFCLPKGPMKKEERYLFCINRQDHDMVYTALTELDKKANESLCDQLTNIDGLPSKYLATLEKSGQNLRPIFNEKGAAFLKLSTDCTIFNWFGTEKYEGELGCGRYQLLLRAASIYLGPHGSTKYHASLQVKVCQVRYKPEESQCVMDKFLFRPENDGDYSINNWPNNQMHAVELGLLPYDEDEAVRTPEIMDVSTTTKVSRKRNTSGLKSTPKGKRGKDNPVNFLSQWLPVDLDNTSTQRSDEDLWNSQKLLF